MTPSTLLRLALDQFQLGNSTPLQSGKGMSVMNLNRLDFHTRLDHTIGNHNLFSELPAPSQMIPARTEPHGQLYVAFINSLHFEIPILISAKDYT